MKKQTSNRLEFKTWKIIKSLQNLGLANRVFQDFMEEAAIEKIDRILEKNPRAAKLIDEQLTHYPDKG